jgi:hypothetical protein
MAIMKYGLSGTSHFCASCTTRFMYGNARSIDHPFMSVNFRRSSVSSLLCGRVLFFSGGVDTAGVVSGSGAGVGKAFGVAREVGDGAGADAVFGGIGEDFGGADVIGVSLFDFTGDRTAYLFATFNTVLFLADISSIDALAPILNCIHHNFRASFIRLIVIFCVY